MTMTAPIQAPNPSSTARAGKPSANATGTPFNAVLSQEVAQRTAEPAPSQTAKAPQGTAEPAERKVGKEDKSKTETSESPVVIPGSAPEFLAMVADITQLTVKTSAAAVDPSAAMVDTLKQDAKRGKGVGSDLGKATLSEHAGELATRSTLVPADGKYSNISSAASQATDFAATLMQRLSPDARVSAETTTLNAESAPTPSLPSVMPMQQAAASFAAQAATPLADKLLPPVGTPAWDQALGNRIVWMAGSDMQSASLTLNPPDLGPLQVVLNVANNQASATFSAAQPEVRQALEAAMPKLRDMLDAAGIQLGQATVDAGTPNRQENAERHTQYGSRKNDSEGNTIGADSAASALPRPTVIRGQGMVDTFA